MLTLGVHARSSARSSVTQRRFKVTKNLARVGFSEESLQFLKLAGEQDEAAWLEESDAKYQQLIRAPLLALGETLKDALAVESNGYHFPTKGIGRIKKPAKKSPRARSCITT